MNQLNWVLIRGLSRETRHWGQFLEKLKEYYPQSKITVMELPGVGTKYQEKSETSIEGFARALRPDFLKLKKENPGEYGIIAVSMGGMIAMNWVDLYPNDFKAIVIVNSSAGNLSGLFERLSPKAIGKILQLFFSNNLIQREKVILELTTGMKKITPELVQKWASFGEQYPLKRSVFLKQIYAASRFIVPKKMPIPLLILAGEQDQLCLPTCSKILGKHFACPLVLHPSAGHDLPLDDPDWMAKKIFEWQNTIWP